MRYLFLRVVVLMAIAVPTIAGAQVKIKASYGSPSLTQVIFPLGVQAGVFQKHGLSAEAVYIAGRSISALLGGDVQFAFVGGPQTIQARISGADLIVIGGLNRLGQMIVVHPSIKTPADLVGKKVGIGVFGTTSDYGMRLGLKQFNLRPNKDVTFMRPTTNSRENVATFFMTPPCSSFHATRMAQRLVAYRRLPSSLASMELQTPAWLHSRQIKSRTPSGSRPATESVNRSS
jgi:ABC-type nitrate/sulfonate/bicarbonate transport system substrate-binding protein